MRGAEGADTSLLKKLMQNLQSHRVLSNPFLRDKFKLDEIQHYQDLEDYRHLLNAMGAMFYINHKMRDVGSIFVHWREKAARLME